MRAGDTVEIKATSGGDRCDVVARDVFFFSSRRRHTRYWRDWSSDVCSSDLVYYDYAKGAGNGALLPDRSRSSFVFDPRWDKRPWPPKDKYGHAATDQELGLVEIGRASCRERV